MPRNFTEAEVCHIQKVCQIAHAVQASIHDNDDSDHYLLIGEFSWLDPFLICPHKRPNWLDISPIEGAFGYSTPCLN